jgi:hypothetical protein
MKNPAYGPDRATPTVGLSINQSINHYLWCLWPKNCKKIAQNLKFAVEL